VHVAAPGVTSAALAPGTSEPPLLLCVAAVIPRKGHDVLVEALAAVTDRRWTCRFVGALDRAPGHVDRVCRLIRERGLADRIRLVGPRAGAELAATYAAADLLVLPSRAETYGMVVTEALARGIPVLATDVGGVREALGHAPDGSRPGLLVPTTGPGAPGGNAPPLARPTPPTPSPADLGRGPANHADRLGRDRSPPGYGPGAPMTGFSPAWLALRESADARARATDLLDPVRRQLGGVRRVLVRDLGCGTGSMGALAGRSAARTATLDLV